MVDIIEIIEKLQCLNISTENPVLAINKILSIEDKETKKLLLDFLKIILIAVNETCPSDSEFLDKDFIKENEIRCEYECASCWKKAIKQERKLLIKQME